MTDYDRMSADYAANPVRADEVVGPIQVGKPKRYLSNQDLTDIRALLRQLTDIEDHPEWQTIADEGWDGSALITWFGDLTIQRLCERFGVAFPDCEFGE